MKKIILFVILLIIIAIGANRFLKVVQQPPKGLKGKIIFEGTKYTIKEKSPVAGIFDLASTEETILSIEGSGVKLSPDGAKITYYDTDHNIYILNINEMIKKKLMGNENKKYSYAHPSWSPGGDKIIFTRYMQREKGDSSAGEGIYVVNTRGSGLVKIIDNNLDPRYPIFSPDGDKIAFAGYDPNELKNKKILPHIYIANVDGSNIRQLKNISALHFDWSPVGNKICYISEVDKQIHIVNIDGSDDKVITNLPSHGWSCSWSPDGTKIIFDYIPPPFAQTPREIYIINIDGTNLKRFYPKGKWSSISSPQWWAPKK